MFPILILWVSGPCENAKAGVSIMKILGIDGSPRKNGNTETLVKTIPDFFQPPQQLQRFGFSLHPMKSGRGRL
jgi:hypothetical protein